MARQSLPAYLKNAFLSVTYVFSQSSFMKEEHTEERWRAILTGEDPRFRRGRAFMGSLPARSRCRNCQAPLSGVGAPLMRMIGRGVYGKNPRYCTF